MLAEVWEISLKGLKQAKRPAEYHIVTHIRTNLQQLFRIPVGGETGPFAHLSRNAICYSQSTTFNIELVLNTATHTHTY